MNKLMKMATVVVGVGAMLSFAGCGEQDPLAKAANAFRELNTVVSTSGLPLVEGPVKEEQLVELTSGKLDEERKKRAIEGSEKLVAGMPMYKRYIACMKEINKFGFKYFDEASREYQYIYRDGPWHFFELSADKQKECVDNLEKGVANLRKQK